MVLHTAEGGHGAAGQAGGNDVGALTAIARR
jgi:hypothetical protein